MLRTAKCDHLGLLISGFQFTTTSDPSATIDVGSNDVGSVSRSAAGKAAITLRETGLHKRGPISLVGIGADIADGGYGVFDTAPASDVLTAELLNASGSGDDGSGHVLSAGFISAVTDLVRPQSEVKATFQGAILQGYYIDSDGTLLSGGTQGSVSKTGTGTYVVTFTPAFARIVSALACGVGSSAIRTKITALSALSVSISTFDDSGTPSDEAFMLMVLGANRSSDAGRMKRPLKVPQLQPRIIIGSMTDESGTPTPAIGAAANGVTYTVSDQGTGNYDITFSRPFKRAPIVIPCAKDNGAQIEAASTVNGCTIRIFDDGGTAADDDVGFLILGYDNEQEY